ncbi:hypothetical protein B0H16DRAFT_1885671 [Mycena metata]|uniref:Fungal-type protein kinase domain-containing protein n=1 Tax=Mycena metata TaxID=1033252 RepID=A0AAD7J4J6_9AGAR|nr:hypothetical protein B0H16DRAFT_1885671 [Mycena metata]
MFEKPQPSLEPFCHRRQRPPNEMHASGALLTEVPLDFFLNAVLGYVSDAVPQVIELLKEDGHIVNGSWEQFSSCDDTFQRMAEILQDFVQIFDSVSRISQRVLRRTPTVIFTTAILEPPGRSRAPGAEFQMPASDVDVPGSFRRAVPWQLETLPSTGAVAPCAWIERELVWSCHDVLREDARRRFTFGVTTNENSMRVWFFSRSHEFVTTPFSFVSDPRSVVHMFFGLAFATPEQLGYDSSISCFVDNAKNIQYRLFVGGAAYITKKILSDNRAEASRGRVTRVWEAYREDDPDHIPVVVKDVWTLIPIPRVLRLPVLARGFVKTSSGADDNSFDIIRGCASESFPPGIVNFTPRKHYRIVFKEVGVAFDGLNNLSEVMRALADATQALRLLHRLGLVYRDVSAGNILLVDGVGKLSDLEYIRSFEVRPTLDSSDRRAGTPEYTSAEFWFNPLHDLESLVWIALFVIAYHRRRTTAAMRDVLDRFFPRQFCDQTVAARLVAIKSPILPISSSDPLFPVVRSLDLVRAHIFSHFTRFYADFRDDYFTLDAGHRSNQVSSFGQLHSTVFDVYETAMVQAQGISLATPEPEKRKASHEAQKHFPEDKGTGHEDR